MIPQWTAAQIRRRRHSLLLGVVPDTQFSTLVASPWGFTDSDTTVTVTTKDANDDAMAGVVWTASAETFTLDADACFVSTDKTDIDSDGVEVCTVTIQLMKNIDGEFVGLHNVAANQFSIAVSGAGNTITQVASATDVDGVTTGSFVTTQAAANLTVTVTACGVTLDAVTVTTDGGYVPPAPGDPFFEDSFETGSRTNDNGYVWGSTGSRVAVSNTRAYGGGTYSLRCRFGPDADGADSSAEQGFNVGQDLTEVWVEWQLWVPSNFTLRTQSPGNNKLFAMWANSYSTTGDTQVVFEYDQNAGGNYPIRVLSMNNNANTLGTKFTHVLSTSMNGSWVRFRVHLKVATTATSEDGEIEIWRDTTKVYEFLTHDLNFSGGNNFFRNGYFLGWSNSGFTDETDFFIDAVKFYDTDPNWTF